MNMPSNIDTQRVLSDSIDIHLDAAESPRTRRRRETSADRARRHFDSLRVTFEKTISGHYRKGRAYDAVGVLLISWQDDDLQVWTQEIEELRNIFRDQYHFEVDHYHIPTTTALTGLNYKTSEFAHRYDSVHKLLIVYYGGHGGSDDRQHLKLYARSRANHDGHVFVPFDDIVLNLQRCHADILVIVDCCKAALAFGHAEVGKHKFEILAATGPDQETDAPHGTNSFTNILCSTLKGLAQEPRIFTTSKLYRTIYLQADPRNKPFLFDMSIHDWGRISLQPVKVSTEESENEDDQLGHYRESASGDAFLHLQLRMRAKPKVTTVNELARAMQYLPHVKEIKYTSMHAPRKELEGFMRGVTQAMKIRPLITKLRRKMDIDKTADHENRPGQDVDDRTLIFNWDDSKLEQGYKQADAGTQVESQSFQEVLAISASGSAHASLRSTACADSADVQHQYMQPDERTRPPERL